MMAPRTGRLRTAVAFAMLLAATASSAQTPTAAPTPTPTAPPAPAPIDAKLEERVKALTTELRCLVCQNQTVADSTSPVANDLRDQVRAQLAAGKNEAEVKQYMTDRFGDFVLYKPPLKAATVILWAGPFLVLAFAGVLLLRRLRQTTRSAPAATLTDEDRERARALLRDETNPTDRQAS